MLGDKKILIMMAAALAVIILFKIKSRLSKKKELKLIAEDKLRDQALNKALANDLCGSSTSSANIESLPYEVDYDQKQSKSHLTKQGKIMLQITACSELSKRKFMIELKDHIKIGRGKENEIVIKDPKALMVHCEIIRVHDEVYVRDFSGNRTILNRKRQKVYVDKKGVKLRTGDKLMIENTILEITIIDKME